MKEIIYFGKDSISVEINRGKMGLCFVMHGLGSFKEKPHILSIAKPFQELGFTTISFDCRHSFGESSGDYEEATLSSYFEDLKSVITWAKSQEWYEEPFILAGHSLGAISSFYFAKNNHKLIKGIVSVSTVVSGSLYLKSLNPHLLEEYEKTGWKIDRDKMIPNLIKHLRWKPFIEDLLKYDILQFANSLEMPILIVSGEKDKSTILANQKILFNKLPNAEIQVIRNAPHTLIEEIQLKELRDCIKEWVKKNLI